MTKFVKVQNPLIPLDYPDPDVIRVGDTYYMVTTTMHFMPGCEILRSFDLVHWEHATYVYERLDSTLGQRLAGLENSYGKGMWAACLRHHQGKFYVFFVANDTRQTYLYTAETITGPWEKKIIPGFYHDCSVLFDEGRVFIVYGNTDIWLTELAADLSGPKPGGLHRVIISEKNNPNLGYEGAHFYKINGKYYVFLIHSDPNEWRRIEACFMAENLEGVFVGQDVFNDDLGYCNQGVAQGGIVDTPAGDWYAVLFQDRGAVGRLPILLPVTWRGDFPVIGNQGRNPKEVQVTLPEVPHDYLPLVGSDDFKVAAKTPYHLAPQWQFNHEPDLNGFNYHPERGTFRITTTKIAQTLTESQNTLTQRMQYPTCSGTITLNGSEMQDGDYAGLAAFQSAYGMIALTKEAGQYYLVMRTRELDNPGLQAMSTMEREDVEWARLLWEGPEITLKVTADFHEMTDLTRFYYQKDGTFLQLGEAHQVAFKMDHFTGCRFGLFAYSTKRSGGSAVFQNFIYQS